MNKAEWMVVLTKLKKERLLNIGCACYCQTCTYENRCDICESTAAKCADGVAEFMAARDERERNQE